MDGPPITAKDDPPITGLKIRHVRAKVLLTSSFAVLALSIGAAAQLQKDATAIDKSNPFQKLPPGFSGDELVLRFAFYYNMQVE